MTSPVCIKSIAASVVGISRAYQIDDADDQINSTGCSNLMTPCRRYTVAEATGFNRLLVLIASQGAFILT